MTMASEIGSIQPNPYLFNIENRRKRKARLAHEIGAGARCRKCEDKCPGFQLHFWRKLCQNCRCGKDDHEVEDEEEDIGKIVIGKLFERPIRTKEEEQQYSYGTDLEMINASTGQSEKLTFDWVPPGVETAVAKRYMEMLPPDKRPVAGSEAAKERRRQLGHQLPLYDVDASERCERLPSEELQNFERYLRDLRTRVAGQGEVVSLHPSHALAYPPPTDNSLPLPDEDLPPPPDSWIVSGDLDSERLENVLNNNLGAPLPFRTPLGSEQRLQGTPQLTEALAGLALLSNNKTPSEDGLERCSSVRSQPFAPVRSELAVSPDQGKPQLGTGSRSPVCPPKNLNAMTASKSSVIQLATPKPFMARYEKPTLQREQFSSRLTRPPPNPLRAAAPLLQRPPVPNINDVARFTGSLPQMSPAGGRVTVYNAVQAPYMAQKDTLVAPSSHSAVGSEVTVLLPGESGSIKSPKHSSSILTQFQCQYCHQLMKSGDVAVICEKAGPGKYWHPKCFVCLTCNELLADLIYFYKDGQVFCGRHYTQAVDIPRCKACDELIFGDSWTRADGCDWHLHHFCCFVCDRPLAGSKYVPDEKDFPHCLSCHMAFKAKMCETCEDKITPEQTRATYNGYFFHALPECFCCFRCRASLMGQKFKMIRNWVFCSQECVLASHAEINANSNPSKRDG